ncbi:hypothetical protein EV363DRAFT_409989 [Boletus edulis]|nr:hypothetical protein EV363DRAFT_409989 [Boletus edulis]
MWGPGCIGFIVAMFLYGVEISQFVFYLQAFPCDSVTVKLQVYIVAVLDTAHSSTLISGFYHLWITCRANTSPACSYHVSWIVIVSITLVLLCSKSLDNQWSEHDRYFCVEVIQRPTNEVLFSTKYTPMSSIASAVCDAIITLSVMYYLRPRSIRYGLCLHPVVEMSIALACSRRQNLVKRLLVVFVEMGMFTFINALLMVVLYYIQIPMLGQFLTVAPGVILSKTYVNSMLAVLNARKPIRDEERNALARSIELPTIVTLR